MKLVKLVTPAAIAILLLVISCTGPAETPGTPTPTPTLPAEGKTIVVDSTADSGSGTLRQALLDAESGDTITFGPSVFTPSAQATIYLTTSLPLISPGNLKIDASDAGVILDGSNIPSTGDWISGLEINSDGNIVQGLQIVNFSPAVGIGLGGGAQNNTIGGDRSVGSGPLGQGNLVSKVNTGIALFGDGTCFNTITGNLIGTDPTGTDAWGNDGVGVDVFEGASRNIIGPDNIIAYNKECGVQIRHSNSFGNTITQNSIHDSDVGVAILKGASYNIIGPDNIIAYNNGCNVEIRDSNSSGNTITQNSIHDSKERVFEVMEGGIFLGKGGNTELPAPVILDFDLAAGTVTGFAYADCTIEVFSDSSDEGEVYEGQATADSSGFFTFSKGASLAGPHLTATATDGDGNTSEFSVATLGTSRSLVLQQGNNLPKIRLQPKQSPEPEDNRVGIFAHCFWGPGGQGVFPGAVLDASHILKLGVKRARLAIKSVDAPDPELLIDIARDRPEFSIDPSHDEFITSLAENGVTITYVLSFWDAEYVAQGGEVRYPRFKTEGEIERYLDFVQFIVHHFKDRIEYYEIWNEPDCRGKIQCIEVEDYINLVKRAVPVIRQEYPEAKIVVGGTAYLMPTGSQDYLFTILRSDVMPLVDVVSWHPMYSTSPEYDSCREYYYEYPSIVQKIKDVASAHGFTGEYEADEISWITSDQAVPGFHTYRETRSAKYYARGIVMHLGMDVTLTTIPMLWKPQIDRTIQNLCNVMVGAEPVNVSVEIQSEATNITKYTFSLPNGDKLLALWTDGVAVDDDPGVEVTLMLPGFSAQKVVGIDVLNGFEQELITSIEDGNLVIRSLLVKDYPIILRLSD